MSVVGATIAGGGASENSKADDLRSRTDGFPQNQSIFGLAAVLALRITDRPRTKRAHGSYHYGGGGCTMVGVSNEVVMDRRPVDVFEWNSRECWSLVPRTSHGQPEHASIPIGLEKAKTGPSIVDLQKQARSRTERLSVGRKVCRGGGRNRP